MRESQSFTNIQSLGMKTSILAGLCILLFAVSTASAATSQGLAWGISTNDRFDFHFNYTDYKYPEYTRSFDFYIEVASLTEIPDPILSITGLPYLNISRDLDYYFVNGTSAEVYSALLPCLVLPIGNWTHWTTIFENIEYRVEQNGLLVVSNTPTFWSYSTSYGGADQFSEEGTTTYLKEDGVLTYFHDFAHSDDGRPTMSYEIVRVGYEPTSPLIMIGIVGVGLVAVVVIVLYKRKR